MSERRFGRTPDRMSLAVYSLWCTKYRNLGGRVAAEDGGWQIVAKEVMPDYVRLFVRVGQTDASAQVVHRFKGRTARVLRHELPHLCSRSTAVWAPSYFATSVEYLSASAVRRGGEQQWAVAS